MYVFEDPEPNGEVEQDLMMELDYRPYIYMFRCVLCVCVCLGINVCFCVYLHAVIFCKLDHFHVCTLRGVYCTFFNFIYLFILENVCRQLHNTTSKERN